MRRPVFPIAGPLLATAGAVIVVSGSFLPWLRSGRRERSSYQMYGLARRLGFADGLLARTAVALWPAVPVVAIGVTVAVWAGARVAGAVLAILCGVYVGAICVVAWRAPLPSLAGVTVCAVGAGCFAVASGLLLGRRVT